jgi:hypothetical protein
MSSQNSDITLYTTQTPNGIKISITLEELGYVQVYRTSLGMNGIVFLFPARARESAYVTAFHHVVFILT